MRSKKDNRRARARLAIAIKRWKAASGVYCANVLRPDLDNAGKRKLAKTILRLGNNQDRTVPRKRISPAAVAEMFFRQSQMRLSHMSPPAILQSNWLRN